MLNASRFGTQWRVPLGDLLSTESGGRILSGAIRGGAFYEWTPKGRQCLVVRAHPETRELLAVELPGGQVACLAHRNPVHGSKLFEERLPQQMRRPKSQLVKVVLSLLPEDGSPVSFMDKVFPHFVGGHWDALMVEDGLVGASNRVASLRELFARHPGIFHFDTFKSARVSRVLDEAGSSAALSEGDLVRAVLEMVPEQEGKSVSLREIANRFHRNWKLLTSAWALYGTEKSVLLRIVERHPHLIELSRSHSGEGWVSRVVSRVGVEKTKPKPSGPLRYPHVAEYVAKWRAPLHREAVRSVLDAPSHRCSVMLSDAMATRWPGPDGSEGEITFDSSSAGAGIGDLLCVRAWGGTPRGPKNNLFGNIFYGRVVSATWGVLQWVLTGPELPSTASYHGEPVVVELMPMTVPMRAMLQGLADVSGTQERLRAPLHSLLSAGTEEEGDAAALLPPAPWSWDDIAMVRAKTNRKSGSLNAQQRAAVDVILECEEPLVVVHGVPGGGKSSTAARAIREINALGGRSLYLAQSNCAVDVVANLVHDLPGGAVRVFSRAIEMAECASFRIVNEALYGSAHGKGRELMWDPAAVPEHVRSISLHNVVRQGEFNPSYVVTTPTLACFYVATDLFVSPSLSHSRHRPSPSPIVRPFLRSPAEPTSLWLSSLPPRVFSHRA